ncbi:MAG TPA: hypothetical protein DCO75_04470 [Fibrobacteres bacterium]|jgi:hypothetical protein|nr:hypothetical protein [Fibrobacterota bacterium]
MVCTYDHECLFGHIVDAKMHLNDSGRILQNEWERSFVIQRELLPDEFVVMPNHFHGIVRLVETGKQTCVPVVRGGGIETSGVKLRTSIIINLFPDFKNCHSGSSDQKIFSFLQKIN